MNILNKYFIRKYIYLWQNLWKRFRLKSDIHRDNNKSFCFLFGCIEKIKHHLFYACKGQTQSFVYVVIYCIREHDANFCLLHLSTVIFYKAQKIYLNAYRVINVAILIFPPKDMNHASSINPAALLLGYKKYNRRGSKELFKFQQKEKFNVLNLLHASSFLFYRMKSMIR